MNFGFFMMPAHSHTENPTLAFERDLELIEYALKRNSCQSYQGGSRNRGVLSCSLIARPTEWMGFRLDAASEES